MKWIRNLCIVISWKISRGYLVVCIPRKLTDFRNVRDLYFLVLGPFQQMLYYVLLSVHQDSIQLYPDINIFLFFSLQLLLVRVT